MAAIAETRSRVFETFQTFKHTYGYVPPSRAALHLSAQGEKSHALQPILAREMYRHPTRKFLVEDANETLAGLIDAGDTVRIWTDEYLIRVATSGLGSLKQRLPHSERHRFSVAWGKDKHALLFNQLKQAASENILTIAVVDDNMQNLCNAHQAIANATPLRGFFFWMDSSEQTKGPQTKLPFQKVDSIRELTLIREGLLQERRATVPILWLIDFNHTLINTRAFEQSMEESVSYILTFGSSLRIVNE